MINKNPSIIKPALRAIHISQERVNLVQFRLMLSKSLKHHLQARNNLKEILKFRPDDDDDNHQPNDNLMEIGLKIGGTLSLTCSLIFCVFRAGHIQNVTFVVSWETVLSFHILLLLLFETDVGQYFFSDPTISDFSTKCLFVKKRVIAVLQKFCYSSNHAANIAAALVHCTVLK